jgi:hypothetical protein
VPSGGEQSELIAEFFGGAELILSTVLQGVFIHCTTTWIPRRMSEHAERYDDSSSMRLAP